jgi:hypothetical protein
LALDLALLHAAHQDDKPHAARVGEISAGSISSAFCAANTATPMTTIIGSAMSHSPYATPPRLRAASRRKR